MYIIAIIKLMNKKRNKLKKKLNTLKTLPYNDIYVPSYQSPASFTLHLNTYVRAGQRI